MDNKKIPTKKNIDNFLKDEIYDDYLSTILTKKTNLFVLEKTKRKKNCY